jgi:predicted dienelactone hydrolase
MVLSYIDEAIWPGNELDGLIDEQEVAVIGHSYGGYTALAAAGARLDSSALEAACDTAYRADDPVVFQCDALLPHLNEMAALAGLSSVPTGLWPAWADQRVDAIVAMAGDAIMFGERGLSEITVPLMALGGTADTDSPFASGTDFAYEHVSSTRKVEVALEGAEHFVFAGGCDNVRRIMKLVSLGFCADPAWDRDEAQSLVRHEVTAFLSAELLRSPDAASALSEAPHSFDGARYRTEGY